MDDATKILLPLILSPILGVIAALITADYKFRQQQQSEREKEKEHIRLKFLNPLLVASEDLLARIVDIKHRRKDLSKCDDMKRWFRTIKDNSWQEQRDFGIWVNDEGYFAMSTLYITAVYFYYAGRIRRDFPYIALTSGGETALLSRLSEVRRSIGGKFGIWETMQDSLGAYLTTEEDVVKNYREFCEMIIGRTEDIWFNRLIDFYRDIHMKLDDHLDNIEHSLKELITFLNTNLQIKATEYRINTKSLEQLRRHPLPADMVDKLEALKDQEFQAEVDFVATLVECLGQDIADDYKPSILNCAERRSA